MPEDFLSNGYIVCVWWHTFVSSPYKMFCSLLPSVTGMGLHSNIEVKWGTIQAVHLISPREEVLRLTPVSTDNAGIFLVALYHTEKVLVWFWLAAIVFFFFLNCVSGCVKCFFSASIQKVTSYLFFDVVNNIDWIFLGNIL